MAKPEEGLHHRRGEGRHRLPEDAVAIARYALLFVRGVLHPPHLERWRESRVALDEAGPSLAERARVAELVESEQLVELELLNHLQHLGVHLRLRHLLLLGGLRGFEVEVDSVVEVSEPEDVVVFVRRVEPVGSNLSRGVA